MVHPAFRERGRAIPQSQPQEKPAPPSKLIPKVIVPGRPGPVPGMRPTIGGAGHVVPAPKQGAGSMGLIMPIYTIGIIIFFTYTVMKVLFKKQPDSLYPSVDADATFRREVFESAKVHLRPRTEKDGVSTKLVVNAMSALLDEVDQELSARHKASEVTDQDVVANGRIVTREEDHASVKVLGMETTASCEGGKKWSRPDSPVLPAHPQSADPIEPPQEIFLEGSLPPQSHLLVTDSATEAQNVNSEEDPAVVLAGKMTLSVISLDSSDNLTDESSNGGKNGERSSSNTSEDFEKIEADCQLGQINDAIEEAQNIGVKQSLLDEIRDETNQNKGDANMEILEVIEDSEKGNIEAQLKENYSEPELPITEDELKLEGEIEESEQKMEETKQLTLNQDIPETNVEEITEKSTINEKKSVEAECKEQELAQSHPVELKDTVTEEKMSSDINEESSPDILVDLHPSEKTVEESINLDREAMKANGGVTISESEEEVEEEEEEEEIEYEYEESDDEVDEEIRNVERMDEQDERPSQRMNGGDFDHSKNGTISDANMAENDISDDENSDDEDVKEEIIEYVTDEEDADLIENSVNHVNDN
ncbi:unnamed protein product [Phaedon cochleariae]|uniref:Resistance to inhibitors of cholinesterase protein 3 N-terminal domain-containing protein n=1 Tax=Phaedon cochleariae TaxID=80249 RepID=A0A9N9SBS7_PHACE|nr:unnamed protein product [Phaedon cochleariae]